MNSRGNITKLAMAGDASSLGINVDIRTPQALKQNAPTRTASTSATAWSGKVTS